MCQRNCTECEHAIVEHLWDDFCYYCEIKQEIIYLNEEENDLSE